MQDLDIDKLLGVMESDKVGGNMTSVMDMLTQANKVMGQITSLMDKMEKMGLKPLIVRGFGAKLGVDPETPLRKDDSVLPTTPTHEELYKRLNGMSVEELSVMFNPPTEVSDEQETD